MLGNLKATWSKPDNYELFPTVSCAYFGLIPAWLLALYQELEWYQKQKYRSIYSIYSYETPIDVLLIDSMHTDLNWIE